MTWEEEYQKKIVTPEAAVGIIKPTDVVVFAQGTTSRTLTTALVARKDELKGLRLVVYSLWVDFGWKQPSLDGTFKLEVPYVLPTVQDMVDKRLCDYIVSTPLYDNYLSQETPDVLILEVSPPDKHGYCSFGHYVWHKRNQIKNARTVIAEINKSLIHTYGDNFVHVSDIDYFVEEKAESQREDIAKARRTVMASATDIERKIAENVASLIKDGDTIEIGTRGPAEWVPRLGFLDDRKDLGVHTEIIPSGLILLAEKDVVTCRRKNVNTGRMVCTQLEPSRRVLEFAADNPMVEIRDASYVLDPRIIASNDNMVAINSVAGIDLTGQMMAESIGPRIISGVGGQLSFVIGSNLSKDGRSITTCPTTAAGGTVSRIVPQLPAGTIISVPRSLADYVVSEYGIAKLKGKTQRQRASELITIAHPDHRAQLRKEADKLFG